MLPERVSSYTVEEELGEGGMAVVYKARHSVLEGESVAIKVLHSHLTRNQSVKQRFLNEAKMMHSLRHENIVSVKDVFEFDGRLVIVMEYISGRPLSRIIGEEVGPIPYTKAIPLFMQILEGTAYAHSKGIVHRDLKPDNILVDDSGRVKILDFGIAKISGESNLTRTGARVGTPSYMAPEQVLGKEVDARTDIYSLGITLYEMLAGVLPFEKQSTSEYELMRAIVDGSIPDPRESYPHIPEELVTTLFKAVSKEPEKRYLDCSVFAEALNAIQDEDIESSDFVFAGDTAASEEGKDTGFSLSSALKEDFPLETGKTQCNLFSSMRNGRIVSDPCKKAGIVDIETSEKEVILPLPLKAAHSMQQVRAVLLDPNGRSCAAAGRSTLLALDISTDKEKTLRLPGGYERSADSIHGYHAIITGENQISLWNSMFSSELGYISSIDNEIKDVAFQSGDDLVILAGNSLLSCSLASVWRRNPGIQALVRLPNAHGRLCDVSCDGQYFAIADLFGRVNIYSFTGLKSLVHIDSGCSVKEICFSPLGSHLAILTFEGRLMVVEVDSWKVFRFPKELALLDVCFINDKLAASTFNDVLCFWDCGRFDEYRMTVLGELVTGVYGSQKSSVFAVSFNSGGVKLFSLEDTVCV